MDNNNNKKNIEDALYNILYRYYKKHNSLPSTGRGMVHKGLLAKNDMVDYSIDKDGKYIKVSYMYYENCNDEGSFYSSSFYIQ